MIATMSYLVCCARSRDNSETHAHKPEPQVTSHLNNPGGVAGGGGQEFWEVRGVRSRCGLCAADVSLAVGCSVALSAAVGRTCGGSAAAISSG